MRRLVVALAMPLAWLAPLEAVAQTNPSAPPQSAQAADPAIVTSRLWLTGGAAFGTVRGDCQTCEEDFPYRHSTSVLVNAGYRVNRRMDVGAEMLWTPVDTEDGQMKTTHVDAVAQFRPWVSKGFFVKGGAGMAFLRNWVDAIGPNAINQKALSVIIGGGWAFRPEERVGYQLFAAQHVAALGDVQTSTGTVVDVVGNFWTVGVAIVIR